MDQDGREVAAGSIIDVYLTTDRCVADARRTLSELPNSVAGVERVELFDASPPCHGY